MKKIIVYDNDGRIVADWKKNEENSYSYMEVDLPEDAVLEKVKKDNEEITLEWHEKKEEPEPAAEAWKELVSSTLTAVLNGANIRDIISGLKLSNAEKWKLEEEVKAYGI